MQQPAGGVASGHVSMLLQPGYLLGETVLRPAKVAVAP
jgi:molecular chaperone GrpE (heat shock protein)